MRAVTLALARGCNRVPNHRHAVASPEEPQRGVRDADVGLEPGQDERPAAGALEGVENLRNRSDPEYGLGEHGRAWW